MSPKHSSLEGNTSFRDWSSGTEITFSCCHYTLGLLLVSFNHYASELLLGQTLKNAIALAFLLMKQRAARAFWGRARTQKTDGGQCTSRFRFQAHSFPEAIYAC